jgi:hypothetical protein
MEPQWTKNISSNAVCSTYYGIFIFYAVLGAITLIGTLAMIFGMKMPRVLAVGYGFYGLIMSALLFVLSLFQYLVCSRALLGEQVVTLKKADAQ